MSVFCHECGNVSFIDGEDGFLYCNGCSARMDDYMETEIDTDEMPSGKQAIYSVRHGHRSSCDELRQSQLNIVPEGVEGGGDAFVDNGDGPTGPSDFGYTPSNLSYDDHYSEIRSRYVKGFQIMIQLQVKALLEKFNASPLIVGLVGPIWLRFLAVTKIMADEWADDAIHESESHIQDEGKTFQPRFKHRTEPHSMFGQRAVTIWHRSLREKLPLSYSLAISFLVCHLSRESVLPTDIIKWVLEEKLPYISAFIEIEKQIGYPSSACPIRSYCMFRPTKVISFQRLEALAAYIAQKIGLELPPVNFHGIASRFLVYLSVPVNDILRQACQICEWSMPPDLFISANMARLPTRVCVMAILIVTIRIVYDINGFGKWEGSLLSSSSSPSDEGNVNKHVNSLFATDDTEEKFPSLYENASDDEDFELDTVSLLKMLQTKHSETRDAHDYSGDLSSYLKYCKEVIFTGSGPSFEDHEEENIIRELWAFYHNEGMKQLSDQEMCRQPRDLCGNIFTAADDIPRKCNDHEAAECNGIPLQDASKSATNQKDKTQSSIEARRDEAIRQLKLDMDENRFSYIPPRRQTKKLGYIYYSRKKMEGSYVYACHADYYILLRACAGVAQIDPRVLHFGVLKLERRLKQLEGMIDQLYHCQKPRRECDSPAIVKRI
ncbi:OLC1v1030269C1 [Oldenlandia corymbosa var. corymbosa]|uniref:OLC1v1030269C1 n=1 Tax=Oldenlandia corymbosa var. corymbosa TaxID=529605 RepID=A0AAV1CGG0_OLDCO|nr:OLC1v1030269C1 [Oldenlandia corymbosa var. corymbosa]